jgi:Ca-activated chloride channel family protein
MQNRMMYRCRRSAAAIGLLVATGCSPTFALAKEAKIADVVKLADSVQLSAQLGTPVVLADAPARAFLKVGVTGTRPARGEQRTPANIAIVLDKSSSMGGRKIVEARRAAELAVQALGARDVVSVVTFDSVVDVVVPATEVIEKDAIVAAIRRINPSGSTALFGGVAIGAAQLRKVLDPNRVNRVILLSDGEANVGPSSPGELAQLGRSLAEEGISVTTIGLGLSYNEDLMTQLARASDGNHAFVKDAGDLARIFEYELGDVLSVVAQDVDLRIDLANGVLPVRVLGRDALIDGRTVRTSINQIYAEQEKFVLLEVDVTPTAAGRTRSLAEVAVNYADPMRGARGASTERVNLKASRSRAAVAEQTNEDVMVAATELIATDAVQLAMALRDQGKLGEAREVLEHNAQLLDEKAKKYRSKRLERQRELNVDFSENLNDGRWNETRKQMQDETHAVELQQVW